MTLVIEVQIARPGAPKAAPEGYIYQEGQRAPLGNARTYELQGQRLPGGACHFKYPELVVMSSGDALLSREIAINQTDCKKIVEEGIPSDEPAAQPDDMGIVLAIPESDKGPLGAAAVTSTASGYAWAWWEDLPGLKVNQDKTNISWSYNGTCAQGGTTIGEWYWNHGSGWVIRSYSGSEMEICSYYRGHTQSLFENLVVCGSPPGVRTFYDWVRAYGYHSGALGGTRSSTTYNSCLPLFLRFQVKKN